MVSVATRTFVPPSIVSSPFKVLSFITPKYPPPGLMYVANASTVMFLVTSVGVPSVLLTIILSSPSGLTISYSVYF